MTTIDGAAGTGPAAPGPDDTLDAHAALIAAGFTSVAALCCLETLHDAGFMVCRPATLVGRLVDAAVDLAP